MKTSGRLGLALGAIFGLGCAVAGFSVEIIFPGQPSKDLARRIQVYVIDPGPEANCNRLLNLSAQAGDPQYVIEAELDIPMDGSEAKGSLGLSSEGPKLFFAEAFDDADVVLLVGCVPVDVGDSEREITISLQVPNPQCQKDEDCPDDGLWCKGDVVCSQGSCESRARDCDDLVDCTDDACDEEADRCVHTPNDARCDDGDVCNGLETCDPQSGCLLGEALICDDGVFCNGQEICDPVEGCQDGPEPSCDDGIPCTNDRCRSGTDICEHTPNEGGCPVFHIGPSQARCPHVDALGGETTACDYVGFFALQEAALDAPGQGAVFYLYDDQGQQAFFDSQASIPALSFIGAAPGIEPEQVVLIGVALHLAGDGVHVAGLSMVSLAGAQCAISAWPSLSDSNGATSGHLIENLRAFAVDQEVLGSNSLEAPVKIGSDTLVRNCLFYGHWDMNLRLQRAHRSRFLNNTFVPHQVISSVIHLEGVEDLVFANNVVLSLSRQEPLLAVGDLDTTGLVMQGNLLEGYAEIVSGLDMADTSNLTDGNLLAEAQMRSPMEPVFLADADRIPVYAGEVSGQSLDGVELAELGQVLPGAFQRRAEESGPRRSVLRVGYEDCAGQACDLTQFLDDELQIAVWSSWPGGTIELYPSDYFYSGFAVVSKPLTIRGMGSEPEEVVLTNSPQDPLLSFVNPWDRHDAMLIVLRDIPGAVRLENLGIFLDSTQPGDDSAIFVETRSSQEPLAWHEFRRLEIGGTGAEGGLFQAMLLGDQVLVQDVLIHGDYHHCLTFGPRRQESYETPATSSRVVNLSCRLTGQAPLEPRAAFGVASVVDALFVNLVLESVAEVPLFMAQRRSSGDTGLTALDPPESFEVQALTQRGFVPIFDGFEESDGSYLLSEVESLSEADPLFVSETDSRLAEGCTAIDSGVDPATVDSDLSAGTSLDGLPRTSGSIDRGAYEQGL